MMATPVLGQDAGLARVWGIDDTEKIRRNDNANPLATDPRNPVWDGGGFRLYAARNEMIAFQIILEAGPNGADSVSVALDSLWTRGYTIRNATGHADPLDYIGKHIELFRETYITVDQRTATPSKWWVRARASDYYTGPVPDGLVPFAVGAARGGTPFAINPNENQAVWCDIYVPRNAPAGMYQGTISVTSRGRPARSLPVGLTVFNVTLSDTTHFHNFFYATQSGIAAKHGVRAYSAAYNAIERAYRAMAHRHRIDLCFAESLDTLAAIGEGYHTGRAYTPQFAYEGPGAGVGNGTYSIGTYDQPEGRISGFYPPTEAAWRAASDRWMAWFSTHAPGVLLFKYMQDEPKETMYPGIRERAAWIHNNPGIGKSLKTFCTVKFDARLEGAVDIWGLTDQSAYMLNDGTRIGYIVSAAAARKNLGEMTAMYNGTRPAFGAFPVIDADAADGRINPWIAWRYRVDLYFLWHTNYYYQQDRRINPWQDNYRMYAGRKAWGDGTLFYPGEDKEFPAFDKGIRGPIASIRMKTWRRGQQDYEYLWLMRQRGMSSLADEIAKSIVPQAFDECPGGQNAQPPWALRGYVFEQARKRMAEALEINRPEK